METNRHLEKDNTNTTKKTPTDNDTDNGTITEKGTDNDAMLLTVMLNLEMVKEAETEMGTQGKSG